MLTTKLQLSFARAHAIADALDSRYAEILDIDIDRGYVTARASEEHHWITGGNVLRIALDTDDTTDTIVNWIYEEALVRDALPLFASRSGKWSN
jgi:hypothetical protein